MKALLYSAKNFLEEFYDYTEGPSKKGGGPEAHFYLRKCCISGFMALDCALSVYWKEIVVPDWANLMGICNELLENDQELDHFCEKMAGSITRGQLVASLRFLENTGDPERFSPSLVDCGIIFGILQDKSNRLPYLDVGQKFCRLQKFRNCVFHTGKNFSEIEAATSVKGLKDLFNQLPLINPVFRDSFDSKTYSKAA
jgi:hypothetical protein